MLVVKLHFFSWLYFPFFVVITITPFPEKAPQIDAAAASFRTVTLSISSGLILLIFPLYGKLSTTINGSGFPLIVLRPLMVITD